MVKKFIGLSIMSKKLNVSHSSFYLKSVIIEAITEHIKPTIAKFIEENNCIQVQPTSNDIVNVNCHIAFEDLKIPVEPDFFNNENQYVQIKEFKANPFYSNSNYCHENQVWFIKLELTDKATRHVAEQVYKFITGDF